MDQGMEQIQRERMTEREVRDLDAGDIVTWIHRLEDDLYAYDELMLDAEEVLEDIDDILEDGHWANTKAEVRRVLGDILKMRGQFYDN